MPRKPNQANKNSIDRLKQLLRQKTGHNYNHFSDIQQLQNQIKKETDDYLSIQTLNRLFGLIKNNFSPSAATLNILSRFLGYRSFSEFESLCCGGAAEEKDLVGYTDLLKALFSDVQPQRCNEAGLLRLARNICNLIEKNPAIAKEFYSVLAGSKFGQRYFFEQFVNVDALNGHYGDGLQYYKLHHRTRGQLFFAYSVLCQRFLLSSQPVAFHSCYAKLQEFSRQEIDTFHPRLVGRYHATRVYHSIVQNAPVITTEESRTALASLRRNKAVQLFPFAEYLFGESLVLAKEYFMAWEILEDGAAYLDRRSPLMDEGIVTQYEILRLYAGYFSGMIVERNAVALLKQLFNKPRYFLAQQYSTFFLLRLQQELLLPGWNKKADAQLAQIITQTGFHYLQQLLETGTGNTGLIMEKKGKKML